MVDRARSVRKVKRLKALRRPQKGLPRSADFESAVSQVCNLHGVRKAARLEVLDGLPIANRRYSRLQTCATSRATEVSLAIAIWSLEFFIGCLVLELGIGD